MEESAAEATFVRSFSSDFASRCCGGRWMEGGCWVAQRWRVWPVWNGSIPGTLEAKPNEEMIWGFTGFQKGGQSSQVKDPETGPKISQDFSRNQKETVPFANSEDFDPPKQYKKGRNTE